MVEPSIEDLAGLLGAIRARCAEALAHQTPAPGRPAWDAPVLYELLSRWIPARAWAALGEACELALVADDWREDAGPLYLAEAAELVLDLCEQPGPWWTAPRLCGQLHEVLGLVDAALGELPGGVQQSAAE